MAVPVKGYPNYLIYEDGRVWSNKTHKFLKPARMTTGYETVELFNKSGSKRFSIHRLVAIAFLPNPNNYPQVNHKDEIKHHNNVENLEWCTAKYNIHYNGGVAKRRSSRSYPKEQFRELALKASRTKWKTTYQYDLENNLIAVFKNAQEASRQTGITHSSICRCCSGERKTAGKFIWKYEKEEIIK